MDRQTHLCSEREKMEKKPSNKEQLTEIKQLTQVSEFKKTP